jgi:hypothetical protein
MTINRWMPCTASLKGVWIIVLQELTSILGYIDGERKKYGAGRLTNPSDDADAAEDLPPSGEGEEGREGGDAGGEEEPEVSVSPFIQTFVFSATLTLPERLRTRLARGTVHPPHLQVPGSKPGISNNVGLCSLRHSSQ